MTFPCGEAPGEHRAPCQQKVSLWLSMSVYTRDFKIHHQKMCNQALACVGSISYCPGPQKEPRLLEGAGCLSPTHRKTG